MASDRGVVLPPLEAWTAETLRLTAFYNPRTDIQELKWWEKVCPELPEQTTTRPRDGGYQSQGDLDKRRLVLSASFNRADWLLSPPEDGEPALGVFPHAVSVFVEKMTLWLNSDQCPDLTRLAFGAVLLQPTEKRESGYEMLARYLPNVTFGPGASSDFLFQINRPREVSFGKEPYVINRLSKWSVELMKRVIMSPTTAPIDLRITEVPGQTTYACRLELDINTPADLATTLPRALVADFLAGLVALGKEIAAKGDIK